MRNDNGEKLPSKRKRINSLIEEFNFEKVHRVMKFLDWRWGNSAAPTIPELEAEARRQLEHVAKSHGTISSGGFIASYIHKVFTLHFYVDTVSDYYLFEV